MSVVRMMGSAQSFGHANETSIGEAHGNVRILLNQLGDWLRIFGKFEGNDKSAASKQCAETPNPSLSDEVVRLGQNRFAYPPRWRKNRELESRPIGGECRGC